MTDDVAAGPMTGHRRSWVVCPACKQECDGFNVSFSKEGTWCNHAGWVLRTGLTRGDPPILSEDGTR